MPKNAGNKNRILRPGVKTGTAAAFVGAAVLCLLLFGRGQSVPARRDSDPCIRRTLRPGIFPDRETEPVRRPNG